MAQPISNRTNTLTAFLISFLLFSLVCANSGHTADKKNFLWKASSKTATVYLLGSVHFFKANMYPLNSKIEDAFEKSSVLAVEANIADIMKIDMKKFISSAFYPGNETLKSHVSGKTFELVSKRLSDSGMPFELFSKYRAWIMALTITSLEVQKLGFDPNYGIDAHFLSKAAGRKQIIELESLDYQINLLSSLSDSEQEAFLLSTLNEQDTLGKEMDQLAAAWQSGDARTMESLASKGLGDKSGQSSLAEKLLYQRNRNMVSKIETFLNTGQTYFVVVGAGHLVGEKGIVELLRRKGVRIEQL